MNPCHCLYCGRMTGHSQQPEHKTVCNACQHKPERSEQRELDAGMRPWARPLVFWVYFFHQTPADDAVAAAAQARWDAEQARIRAFNEAHAGPLPW